MVPIQCGAGIKINREYEARLYESPAWASRGDRGFFAGYFRDLDGNKLCIYYM